MSFLNSLFLWGAAAAATLPIIIHLIKRNKAAKLPFAAIRFLTVAPNERYRSQRLKQFILLALRILALAVLALAFARPFLENQNTAAFWGDEPKAAVVLVDNSYSMAAADKFGEAVEQAREIVSGFRPRDQVTVMQFSEISEVVGETQSNFNSLASQLDARLHVTNRSTNYMQALQSAEAILMESPYNLKRVHLISDFRKTGWDNLNPHWNIQEGIALDLVPVGQDRRDNVAVQDLHVVRDERQTARGDVLARVRNFGLEKKRTKLQLKINKRKIAHRDLMLEPGAEQTVRFRRVSLKGKVVAGSVELDTADDLAVDNRFHFVLENQSTSRILAINGEPAKDVTRDELFFLERAINLPKLARFSLDQIGAAQLQQHDLNRYRAIILANIKDVSRQDVERLAYFVRAGGGLIIALGDQVNASIYNRLFQELTPASLTNRGFSAVDRDNGLILAEIDYQHPIFRLFADAGQSDPSIAEFYQYYHSEPISPEAVIASFDDGSPALLERRVGAGTVVLFTSTLDTEWNNLPVKALYLPLIYQTLQYVAAQPKGQESFLVGSSVSLSRAGSFNNVQVRKPSGDVVQAATALFEDTEEPGIYEIRKPGGRRALAYFVVNVDAAESDLTPVPEIELEQEKTQLAGQVQVASLAAVQLSDQVEKNQKLWRFAVLLVLLLLVAETWLANRTFR